MTSLTSVARAIYYATRPKIGWDQRSPVYRARYLEQARAATDAMGVVWVMAYHTSTVAGSVAHVSHGDRLHLSRDDCQRAIDEISGWIGMGDRSRYRPIPLRMSDDAQEELPR